MTAEIKNLSTDQILEIIEDHITTLSKKISSGRITDTKREELRIKQLRALGYLAKTHTDLITQKKLENLAQEMEEIKEELNKKNNFK